jgi:hypothetical protein
MVDYEKWQEKYYNFRIIYIYDFFNKNDFKILEKLNITVEDKKYTESEYDVIKFFLNLYYSEKYDEEEEKAYMKSLSEKDVSQEDYNRLLEIFEKIDDQFIYSH